MMRPGPFFLLRAATLLSALTLGALGIWIVAAELISPRPGFFPRNASEAQAFSTTRQRASVAAAVGIARGDLWTVAAIAETAPLLFETDSAIRDAVPVVDIQRARVAATHAAKFRHTIHATG